MVVIESDQALVAGDISGVTFQVRLRGAAAEVAFAANEKGAANTAAKPPAACWRHSALTVTVRITLATSYWQLDDSDAPLRPIENCLRKSRRGLRLVGNLRWISQGTRREVTHCVHSRSS